MSSRTVIFDLPERLYEHFAAQAQVAARALSDVVIETLERNSPPAVEEDLPLAPQRELKAMEALSDEAELTDYRPTRSHLYRAKQG